MLARNIPLKAVATEKSSKAWKYFVKIDYSSRIILENRGGKPQNSSKKTKKNWGKLKVSVEPKNTVCRKSVKKKPAKR